MLFAIYNCGMVGKRLESISRRVIASIAWLALLPIISGCSAAFVKGPPPHRVQREKLVCTTSPIPPLVDGILLIGSGVVAYAALSDADGSNDTVIAIYSLGATATFGTSLAYGLIEFNACHEAIKEQRGPYIGEGGKKYQ